MPMRRLGGPASVVPSSPTYVSSESKSSRYSETAVCIFGIASVRRPSSMPRERTRPAAVSVPRASLLWKPSP